MCPQMRGPCVHKNEQAPYFYTARDGGLATESASVNSTACLTTLSAAERETSPHGKEATRAPFNVKGDWSHVLPSRRGRRLTTRTGIQRRPTEHTGAC